MALVLDLLFTILFVKNTEFTTSTDGSIDLLEMESVSFIDATGDYNLRIALMYACSVLSVLGSLAFSLSLLSVIGAWTESMREVGRPYQRKLNKALSSVSVIKVLYTLFGIGHLVCITVTFFLPPSLMIIMAVLSLAHAFCNFWMLVVTIWMAVDLRKPANDAVRVKRNQLIRIIFLVLFEISTGYGSSPLLTRIFSTVFWIAECCLLIWPGTLGELEVSPLRAYPIEDAPAYKV